MSRRRRFVVLFALAALLAGVFVATAAALRFDDASCKDGDTCHPPDGLVGASYQHKLGGDGGNGPPYTFLINGGSLPPGLSLNASSGLITGTPTAAGTYHFEAGLQDNPEPTSFWCVTRGSCASQPFTIKVHPGLQITTNSLPPGATIGTPYSVQLDAQIVTNLNPLAGSPASGAPWSVVSGVGTGLPPGLTMANGLISGTPTAEGSFDFRIQATLNGASHFQTYSLTVRQPLVVSAAKPFATTPAPTLWEVGVPFSSKLTPSGGNGTYTFAIGSGSLPTGVTLGPDGTVSGTPRAAGAYSATLRLADGEGRTLDYAANFGIAARLKVGTLLLKPGKVGKLYRSKLAATGGIAPRKWKVTVGPLPKGIRLDRTTGVLSGTPTKEGRYRVTFQVTDGLKVVASKRLRIDVLP